MDMDSGMSAGMDMTKGPMIQGNDAYHSSMDMSSGAVGMSMGMGMSFFNSINTTLFIPMWTPKNLATYAATCLFLVVLSSTHRLLFVAKEWLETSWIDAERDRRYIATAGKGPLAEQISMNPSSKQMVLSGNGIEEDVLVVQKKGLHGRPWRLTVDPIRALIDTVVTAVGFLIMLAVMTMNIGYFVSVLAGTFIGSLAVGRYRSESH